MFRNLFLAAVAGAALVTFGTGTSFAQMKPLPQLKPALPNPILRPYGLEVTQVLPKSPAARQGIEPGDVIVSVNNRPVRSGQDLNFAVGLSRIAFLEVIDCRTGSLIPVTVYPVGGRLGVSVQPVPLGPIGPVIPPIGPGNRWNRGVQPLPLPLPIQPGNPGFNPSPLLGR